MEHRHDHTMEAAALRFCGACQAAVQLVMSNRRTFGPSALADEQRAWVLKQKLEVRGRIYFSPQGVNAQFGGVREDALAYTRQLEVWDLGRGPSSGAAGRGLLAGCTFW
eukprot:303965-Chlamydomonas_euryale.AAC.1